MDKNKRKESYEPPKMEILEIMVEQAILQMSGWGYDSRHSSVGFPIENKVSFAGLIFPYGTRARGIGSAESESYKLTLSGCVGHDVVVVVASGDEEYR